MILLHAHGTTDISLLSFLSKVLLEGFLDTLNILPFLFLTYLLMEYIEHKASEKVLRFMKRSGALGPLVGGTLGAVPQCAFSAVASSLFTGRVITLGTLISVFLATSDEMIPILLTGNARIESILILLCYKIAVGIVIGFAIDALMHFVLKKKRDIDIDRICENDNCNCERGIFLSAIHHTLTISVFIFAVTLLINSLIFFIGTDALSALGSSAYGLSHLILALVGLIPGCATSVAISTLGLHGIISAGCMLSGLFSNAGVGIIILWRLNPEKKENLLIMLTLVCTGFAFGILADLIGLTI
jgi:hypothetical protein